MLHISLAACFRGSMLLACDGDIVCAGTDLGCTMRTGCINACRGEPDVASHGFATAIEGTRIGAAQVACR